MRYHLKKLTKPVILLSGLACAMQASALDVNISGFATLALTQSDASYETEKDVTDSASINPDSVFALQFDANINEYTHFTAQLLARGHETVYTDEGSEFEPEFEWAYLTLTPTQGSSFKIGRMRNPVFMLSDSLDVGYTYPWVSPPSEVYNRVPISRFEGIMYDYKYAITDDWLLNFGVYAANNEDMGNITTKKSWGTNLVLSSDRQTFRLGYTTINLNIGIPEIDFTSGPTGEYISYAQSIVNTATFVDEQLTANGFGPAMLDTPAKQATLLAQLDDLNSLDNKVEQYGIGYRFEGDLLLVMAEFTGTESATLFTRDIHAGYLTVGAHLPYGLLPHITLASAKTKDANERKKLVNELAVYNYQTITPPGIPAPPGINPVVGSLDNYDRNQEISPEEAGSYLATNNENRDSVTLGLRWDYAARSALKFDVQYMFDFEDSNAFFEDLRDEDDNNVIIYRLAFTTVF